MGCFLVALAGGEDAVNARNTHTTAKFVIGYFVTLAALSPGRAFPQGQHHPPDAARSPPPPVPVPAPSPPSLLSADAGCMVRSGAHIWRTV